MTLKEKVSILKKAIKIAEKNGFDFDKWCWDNTIIDLLGLNGLCKDNTQKILLTDHEFAKKLWYYPQKGFYLQEKWEYNLSRMVLSKCWFTYLKEHI